MRTLFSLSAFVLLAAIFQGCGLKGPLRLPDRAQPVSESPAPQTKTQADDAQ